LSINSKVSIRARHCWRAKRRKTAFLQGSRMVSIRARHCWRAKRLIQCKSSNASAVSIRARHCWRAKPCQSLPKGRRLVRFNPRPPLLAGETLTALL